MNKLLWKSAGIFLFSFLCTFSAWGVPAKSGLIVYKQPDGTELKVRLIGDEFHHYYLSEDGILLLGDATNYLCYASVNNGLIAPSTIKATDISSRSVAANHLLTSQDNKEILKNYTTGMEKETSMLRKSVEQMHKSVSYPTIGKQKVLVILAEFADESFITPNPKESFDRMLNEKGYSENGGTGSVRDYYMASSNNLYEPDIKVYGPVKLPNKMAYYGANDIWGNDMNPAQMVADACKLLDDEIDFSEYDLDHDGFVDNIYVFYAGYGEADGGDANTIWPHQFYVYRGAKITQELDGVLIDRYACSNEIVMKTKKMAGIGTFCHEFGHVLGLPDLYATDYRTDAHPGNWDIMASGSYLNEGNTPPMMSAYERYFLGWTEPLEIKQTDTTFVLPPLIENKVYKISTKKPDEYFLFENRQQKGFDSYLPGHGMLIWHIDYKEYYWNQNKPNNDGSHQYVDIEEAGGIASPDHYDSFPFPGTSNVTSITDKTSPSLKTWNGTASNLGIYNIYETPDSLILFDVIDPSNVLGVVVAQAATDVTPVSFKANWDKLDDATSYVIDVYYQSANIGSAVATKVYVDGYLARHVGNVTSFEVTGLDPEKTYYYRVRARGNKYIGAYSSPIKVHTGDKDYRFFAPTIAAPTQVTDHSFVANWESLKDTKTYYVTAFEVNGEMTEEKADFTKGASVPEGWKSTSYTVFSEKGYYGEAPNSLGLSRDKGYVYSSIKTDAWVGGFSFWHRATENLSEENKLSIYGYTQGDWKLITTIPSLTKAEGGATFSMKTDQFSEMYNAIKIEFNRPGSGTVYIDDICVNYFKPTEFTAIPEYDNKVVGDALSFEVTGLQPLTFYAYQVKGFDGTLESQNSEMYFLMTLSEEAATVSNTESTNPVYAYVAGTELVVKGAKAGMPIAVYDIAGRLIYNEKATAYDTRIQLPSDGLYVVRVESKTFKVIR